MAGYEGLSKWLKFACISGGCALVLFLFSACATGWNSTVAWGDRNNIDGGKNNSTNTAVGLGTLAFICIVLAFFIFMSLMQTEMNKIGLGFICFFYLLGGRLCMRRVP